MRGRIFPLILNFQRRAAAVALKLVLTVECCKTCKVIVTILSVSNSSIEELLCSLRVRASE